MAEAPAPTRQDLDAFMSAVPASVSAGKSLDAEQTRIASAVELALGDRLARDAQPDAARSHWRAAAERERVPAAENCRR